MSLKINKIIYSEITIVLTGDQKDFDLLKDFFQTRKNFFSVSFSEVSKPPTGKSQMTMSFPSCQREAVVSNLQAFLG